MICTNKKTDLLRQRFGGEGEVVLEHVLDEKLYGGKVSTFARVLLKPGCSLGCHEHNGNSETYFIVQGTAVYNDNGTLVELHPGDTAFCPSGESHAIANQSTEDVVFMALIVPA